MLVYLLRHGRAAGFGSAEVRRDEDRPLLPEGAREIDTVIRASAGSLVRPQRILHSPYLRAMQSAEVFARGLGFDGTLQEEPGLVPHGDPEQVLPVVAEAVSAHVEAMALVGHEPLMGRLLATLLMGEPRSSIPFATGMVAAVQVEGSTTLLGQLVFARAP